MNYSILHFIVLVLVIYNWNKTEDFSLAKTINMIGLMGLMWYSTMYVVKNVYVNGDLYILRAVQFNLTATMFWACFTQLKSFKSIFIVSYLSAFIVDFMFIIMKDLPVTALGGAGIADYLVVFPIVSMLMHLIVKNIYKMLHPVKVI